MTKFRLLLIAILLAAFAVRLHNLTTHSLWFDEAVSVHWARQSIPRILEVGFTLEEDRLPPLYYLTLKGWAQLAGFGEFAVRALSVLYGVLLVAVLAALGRLLFNRRVGAMVAALATINPFLVWYSQEARMYAPAAFWSALAVLAAVQGSRAPGSGGAGAQGSRGEKAQSATRDSPFTLHPSPFIIWLALFTVSAIAALYSHLYAGFLLPAVGLWLLVSYPRQWKLWGSFAAAGVIITLAYAPILAAIWRFSGEAAPGSLSDLPQHAWQLLHAFTVWQAPPAGWLQSAVPVIVLIFALLAFLPYHSPFTIHHSPFSPPRAAARNPRLLVSLLLAMPFAIATVLLLRNYLAFFGERYFIVMTPWLLLLAAVGANRIGELANMRIGEWVQHATRNTQLAIRNSPFIILLLASALPLPGQYTPAAAKEAWRQSVAYLAEHATPEDAILIHPDWVRYPFQFYFAGPGQTYAAFSTVTAETELDGPLQGVVGQHPVVWLIQSHVDAPDPERRVEQWFAARYPLVTEQYPPGISLKGYAPGYQLDALPAEATPTDLGFANGLRLVGYRADASASATDALFHPPSGWLHVTLYWQAAQPIAADVAPAAQLVGPEGVWGASLERPGDALKLFPTSRWQPGGPLIRQDMDINLNPATPPGRYQLRVILPGTAEQLVLTEVEVR
ncbi:MAG: hypothetical protein Kow0031_08770 [Anaerolineae bacterium]